MTSADAVSAPERAVPIDEIRRAAERIRGRVHRTPMLTSRAAATEIERRHGVRLHGARQGAARLFLKAEHLQVTGSFKPRGAINRAALLTDAERDRGLITISAGNHAMALAYAASATGARVTVVMPEAASRSKVAAARGYGADVVLHGRDVGETVARMRELEAERGLVYVPPFDDPHVICGQGTVGLEIVEDLPEVNTVVVGVGGGGLISGVAAAVRALRPEARVVGVEPVGSRAMSLALEAGRPVDVRPVSIADGLGAPFAGEWTLPLVRRHCEAVVLVEESEIAAGMRFALERTKQLLEPAGAAALGALLAGRIDLRDGETVCAILSGGNVDVDRLPELLALADAP